MRDADPEAASATTGALDPAVAADALGNLPPQIAADLASGVADPTAAAALLEEMPAEKRAAMVVKMDSDAAAAAASAMDPSAAGEAFEAIQYAAVEGGDVAEALAGSAARNGSRNGSQMGAGSQIGGSRAGSRRASGSALGHGSGVFGENALRETIDDAAYAEASGEEVDWNAGERGRAKGDSRDVARSGGSFLGGILARGSGLLARRDSRGGSERGGGAGVGFGGSERGSYLARGSGYGSDAASEASAALTATVSKMDPFAAAQATSAMDSELATAMHGELPPERAAAIIASGGLDASRAAAMLDSMSTEQADAVMAALPPNVAERVAEDVENAEVRARAAARAVVPGPPALRGAARTACVADEPRRSSSTAPTRAAGNSAAAAPSCAASCIPWRP